MNDRQKPQNNSKKTTPKYAQRPETPDDNRDLRHIRPREGEPDDLRKARQLARQRRRRKLMIQRTLIVSAIALIVLLVGSGIGIKIRADQKSAKGEAVRFLAVKEIVVEGDTRYTDEEIIKASTLYVGQSLLSVDKGNASKALVTNLPYLDGNQVVVDNASFYVLRIKVAEVPVVAAVEDDGDWLILGANNRAMERVKEKDIPDGVVRVVGASTVSTEVGKTLLDDRCLRICGTLLTEANRYGLDSLTTIDVTTKTKICIWVDERIEVVLGGETNLPNQIKALTETLPTLYANNGEDAAGRLNMIFYSDDDKSNDKSIYTPQEVLDKLEEEAKKPMAAVQIGNEWAVINEDNVVLETMPEEHLPEGLVRIEGAAYEAVVVGKELLDVRSLYICHTIIQEANRQETVALESVDIADQTEITVRLSGGIQVLLGESNALEAQVKALAQALPMVWETYGEDAVGLLDMTAYGDDDPDNDKATFTQDVEE